MPNRCRFSRILLGLICLGMTAGCSQLDLKKSSLWFARGEDQSGPATELVAIWVDAVAQTPNRTPTRGFRGQLMFYGPGGSKPIQVDGALVVYTFDEQNRGPGDVKPTRKYVFTPEQFTDHYSKSDLGHAYSVWIPWDKVGGPQQQIALIARFVPVDGPTVMSGQAELVLPGTPTGPTQQRPQLARHHGDGPSGERPVRRAAHETVSEPATSPSQVVADARNRPTQTMRTTTFSIPPHLGRPRPIARPRLWKTRPAREARGSTGEPTSKEAATSPARTPTASSVARQGRQPAVPPSTGYRPGEFQAPGGPTIPPGRGRAPWQQRPAGWPFHSRSIRPPATSSESEMRSQSGWPAPSQAEPWPVGPR